MFVKMTVGPTLVLILFITLSDTYTITLQNEPNIINRSATPSQTPQQAKKFGDYQLLKELKGFCRTTNDCRARAYVCRRQSCECAEGFKSDGNNQTCIGAIGKRCMYDAHCITRAYCKGQTICTCMAEYPFESEDKWSCEDDSSVASRIYGTATSHLIFILTFANIMILRQ